MRFLYYVEQVLSAEQVLNFEGLNSIKRRGMKIDYSFFTLFLDMWLCLALVRYSPGRRQRNMLIMSRSMNQSIRMED